MGRVVDSHQGEHGSRFDPSIFMLMGPFLWVHYRNIDGTPPLFGIVTDDGNMAE